MCGGFIHDASSTDPYAELLAEFADTRAALAGSVQELQTAARRIAHLEKTNTRRRNELKHLVRREAQARVFGN
ncbi:MAG: hypothetical protein ACU85U_00070 [Gammaproteobacteria bacterium]|jgi:hypothetical protein